MDKIPLKPFFVVWRPEGGDPVKRHGYRQDAEREAERIAVANPGSAVYVMAPLGQFRTANVDEQEFEAIHPKSCNCDACIPF